MKRDSFAKALLVLRKNKGWQQVDVAAEVDVTRETICHYETGKTRPNKAVIKKLDEFYGCKGSLVQKWLDCSLRGDESKKIATLTVIRAAFRKIFSRFKL